MISEKSTLLAKRILSSICLSAAILSIANVDTLVQENDRGQEFARERIQLTKNRLRERLEETVAKKSKPRGSTEGLRDSLAQDEFGEQIPFASLSTLDPLANILAKGVKHFERSTFRSPEYQGENGYDLVHYEIEHPGGAHSSIVAYLDRPLLTASRNVGAPDSRVPVVMILEGRGEQSAYSLYRSGNLIEQTQIPSSDVSGLVAQRISQSVPFMSVAR